MEIDWNKVRNVILNDRWHRIYKPDREVINKITRILPDAKVFGFGFRRDVGFWALMVECPNFPDNPYGIIRDIQIKDLYTYATKPQNLKLLPKRGWLW